MCKSPCHLWKKWRLKKYTLSEQIIEVGMFLVKWGFSFHSCDVGFGNYLGLLDLLTKFDPFLAKHINIYANKRCESINHTTEDYIWGIHQSACIIWEIFKKYKYYCISVDSFLDISDFDQKTLCSAIWTSWNFFCFFFKVKMILKVIVVNCSLLSFKRKWHLI